MSPPFDGKVSPGVALNLPLLAASYASDTPHIGNVPDVPVAPSFLLWAAGRDGEMEAAQALIGRPL